MYIAQIDTCIPFLIWVKGTWIPETILRWITPWIIFNLLTLSYLPTLLCELLLFSHSVMSCSLWPPWTAARQASLPFTISWSLLKLMSIESVMPSNCFILCHPLLRLPSVFPSIRVFSNELALRVNNNKKGSLGTNPHSRRSEDNPSLWTLYFKLLQHSYYLISWSQLDAENWHIDKGSVRSHNR